ncbi:hypothetical protein DY000_02003259 [Brassica cretica]|uniref:Uncharacterized protein n=1 Tax=Brassica cretica TaxID=69181 RepID=A0ABQ7C1S7_BRACR|nr:hypothetical protein DY000_02003259 [Brassica cretica]
MIGRYGCPLMFSKIPCLIILTNISCITPSSTTTTMAAGDSVDPVHHLQIPSEKLFLG